jgi:hypothetical protein
MQDARCKIQGTRYRYERYRMQDAGYKECKLHTDARAKSRLADSGSLRVLFLLQADSISG